MATTTSTFKLYKSLIYETVKNETHIAAHVARAMDKNAAELAFQEEAGDESYHDRKLERSLYSSLDKIKAEIIDYLNTESDNSNNLSCTVGTDEIIFTITLSSRFNTSYITPLADLISKYVEDAMLFEWWTPINQNNAKMYAEKAELARLSVLKCFIKNAPSQSPYSYSNVTGEVVDHTTSVAKSALRAKIIEAKTYRDTMTNLDKKTALSEAITAAETVYNSATSVLSDYTSATTTLDTALTTAKAPATSGDSSQANSSTTDTDSETESDSTDTDETDSETNTEGTTTE